MILLKRLFFAPRFARVIFRLNLATRIAVAGWLAGSIDRWIKQCVSMISLEREPFFAPGC